MKAFIVLTILSIAVLFCGQRSSAECDASAKDAITICTVASAKAWNITNINLVIRDRKYCCFIWNALECQLAVAKRCDRQWAKQIEDETVSTFRPNCVATPRNSPKCQAAKASLDNL